MSTKPISTQPPQESHEPQTWHDVYKIFLDISDRILSSTPDHDEAHELIAGEVDCLYAQHEGTWIWDFAYERWYEPSDDDEEVPGA